MEQGFFEWANFWFGATGLAIGFISLLVALGVFQRNRRTIKDLIYIEQERDDARSKLAIARVRLDHVDPERFIDRARELQDKGSYGPLEDLALEFTDKQSEAYGLAAGILAEQRLLDSGEMGQAALTDAKRFCQIGLAANPENTRLKEISKLVLAREKTLANGEPLETLNWEGMNDVELNRLSRVLVLKGHYQLAEIAARRSVPLAILRTGEQSTNAAGAMSQHIETLAFLNLFEEAEQLALLCDRIYNEQVGETSAKYALNLRKLANIYSHMDRHSEAEALYQRLFKIIRGSEAVTQDELSVSLNDFGSFLNKSGRYKEAEKLLLEALEIAEGLPNGKEFRLVAPLLNLASLYAATDRTKEAREHFDRAYSSSLSFHAADHPQTIACKSSLDAFNAANL